MSEAIEQRAMSWIAGDDTGLSSKAIWLHMTGVKPFPRDRRNRWEHPWDPDDLGRCLRLLRLIPEWKDRLPEMTARSKSWARLVPHWDELHQMMADECGVDWEKSREAPKTYYAMKHVLDGIAP